MPKKFNDARVISILLFLLLLPACAAPANTQRFNADTVEWVHIDDIADTYYYEGDLDAEQAQLKNWLDSDGNWDEIQKYLDNLTEANLQVISALGIQDIYSIKDVNDLNAQKAYEKLSTLSDTLYDHQKSMIKLVIESKYVNNFTKLYGQDIVNCINAEEGVDLDIPEENLIIQQRQDAFVADYNLTYKGEDWTFQKLWEDEELSDEDYWTINDGLCAKKNKALGELLLSLVKARNEAVDDAGLGDYPTLMHQAYSYRDYSLEDVISLCEEIKNSKLPEILGKVNEAYKSEYNNYHELNNSIVEYNGTAGIDFFKQLAEVTRTRSETIGKIAAGLQENKLYFYDSYKNGVYAPMMMPLTAYGLGAIYTPKDSTVLDSQALYHEFGHFCNAVIAAPKGNVEKLRDLFIGGGIPLELDSYGMENLILQDYETIYGDYAPAVKLYFLQYALHCIISSALYSEFEISLYRDPPESLEEANARFTDLEEAYGGNLSLEGIPQGMTWAEVSHYFSSQLYYPNYLTAMLPAMGSMVNSMESTEDQYDKYIHLLEIGGSLPYRELLKEVGMQDPFNEGVVEALSVDIEKYVDKTIANFNTYRQ